METQELEREHKSLKSIHASVRKEAFSPKETNLAEWLRELAFIQLQ